MHVNVVEAVAHTIKCHMKSSTSRSKLFVIQTCTYKALERMKFCKRYK